MTPHKISENTYVQILNSFHISKDAIDLFLEIYKLGEPVTKGMVDRFELVKSLKWTKAKVEKIIRELHLNGLILPHTVFKSGGMLIGIQPKEILIQKINYKIKKYQEILVFLGQ
jgi:predicted transcriptional regulator